MASVIPPDLELFLTGWLRSNITDIPGLQVGNRIPDGYDGSYPLVVVRDDGGTQSANRVTFDRSIGVNVLGWTRNDTKPCRDLAARVYGVLTGEPGILIGFAEGSRICAVVPDGCNGPYPVGEDTAWCHYYMTAEYSTAGIRQP